MRSSKGAPIEGVEDCAPPGNSVSLDFSLDMDRYVDMNKENWNVNLGRPDQGRPNEQTSPPRPAEIRSILKPSRFQPSKAEEPPKTYKPIRF